jgi:tight adherence protein B
VKRILLSVLAILVAATSAGAAAAAGATRPSIVEAKGPAFPVRTFVLVLPTDRKLTVSGVQVTENGGAVADPTLVPASEASKKSFGVVLVLDSSWSVRGKPIADALAAERAFVAQLSPNEQVGAIVFNEQPTTVLSPTTSHTKISAALATTPHIGVGSRIFDAVGQAETMLRTANVSSGSIVVLSDGSDTGSTATINEIGQAARNANVRIYTVGLGGKTFNPNELKALAAAGGGKYAQATAGQLTPLYHQLGRLLSNEYLLQYKSLSGPNKPVHVTVHVNGVGTADTDYRTPALPVKSVEVAPYGPSLGSRIWGSVLPMLLIVLLVAAAVALLVVSLLKPRHAGVPARMAEFVSIPGLQRDKVNAGAAQESEDAQQPDRWQQFAATLEIADIQTTPETIVVGTSVATVLAFLIAWAGTGSAWWGLLALVVPYFVREWVLRTLANRRARFAEQLPDALQVIASALRSGHSFAGALAVVVESSSEPMKSEMQRVVADEQLGKPIQDSLGVVADRMASSDVEQLALVAQLQRDAGGDAAEVVDRVAETVRERFDLRRLIQTLTMQGRMSRWIVSLLPIVVIVAIELENPDYLQPLTSSLGGRIVIGLAAAWAIAGSLVIKRIVEIEV